MKSNNRESQKYNFDTFKRRSMLSEPDGVKAVTFDIWETLLFEYDGANMKRKVARLANILETLCELGVRLTERQIQDAMERTEESLFEIWSSDKDVSHTNQLKILFGHLVGGPTSLADEWTERISSAYVAPLFQVPPYLNPDAENVASLLKKRGKLLGVICNTGLTPGSELRKFLSKAGIGKFFDMMIFSDELGVRKPNQFIFHAAARELCARPAEIVHVGDNLRADVWGANNAGFKSIYFVSDQGRDKIDEANPKSPVAISRQLRDLERANIIPTKTVTSFSKVIDALDDIEKAR